MDVFKRYVLAVSRMCKSHFAHFWHIWVLVFILAVIGATFPPSANVPSRSIVHIAKGSSVSDVAKELTDAHIIAHPLVLQLLLRGSGQSTRVQAGAYLFTKPENLFTVAYRVVTGAYHLPPVRITFPEGETVRDIANRVTEAFPDISASDVVSAAQPYEGYLFPDTYLFPPSADVVSIVALMRTNFDTKIATISNEIHVSGRSLSDTVILASLVEKEARTNVSRRIVAGILLNRLKIGMPLQVDAVFGYIFGRDTYSPSFADLKVDSPYNTYTHKGLPPGPINNPGLDSLDAVIHPTKTSYLYYLTGTDNLMHYATTYADHQMNQKKYLR